MAEPGTLANAGRSTNGLEIAGLSLAAVRDLLEPPPGPCLTLSLPTHRNVPENRVDLPSYRHLVESLDMALSLARSRDEIERLLRPFHQLASDRRFWEHTREGLTVFGAEGWARVFLLPKPVKPLAECLEGWLADRSAREQPGAGMGATVTARKDAATRTTRR